MPEIPTTVRFPAPLPARREGTDWWIASDGVEVRVRNVDKPFWEPEGYTKGDLLTFYANIAPWILPYLADRPLTLKRMPDGADGEFFYAKQAPDHTPEWVRTVPVTSADTGKTIDYLLADDRASLVWLANLGCIELHPWHSRTDAIGRPDYAFFDLDPFEVGFAAVRDVALHVRAALTQLGLRGYARTSGATGMQVYVPIDRVHDYAQVREWVGRVCRLIHRADPERTTMEWEIARRTGKVFLDHGMNTEGKNIAATYCLRPEREAPVATPVRWEEVEAGIEPRDFTIATIFERLAALDEDLGAPILEGGQDLRQAMAAVGMDPDTPPGPAGHSTGAAGSPGSGRGEESEAAALARYRAMRDFSRTPEPPGGAPRAEGAPPRFVLQHHLATRLHHDLRLERDGTAPSWALPKGLPDVKGIRHLAVQTEDHPLDYLDFEGEIPAGEYGGGPVRIWDSGTYETVEWEPGKVSFRLHGRRHTGEWHLFRTGGDSQPGQWMVVRADAPAPGTLPSPPPVLAPMLATDGGEPFDDPDWLFEIKWDGVRALATVVRPGTDAPHGTRLVSRQGNDISEGYPELAPLWEHVLARNAVLDGEIVAFDERGRPSFERLQQRMHVREPRALERLRRTVPVSYLVFDVLAVDGEPLIDLPLAARLDRLSDLVVWQGPFRRSEAVARDGVALHAAAREQGLEGIVAKRAASRYLPGRRSRDWRKLKIRHDVEVVIGGWLPGEGGRGGSLGSLLVGLHDQGALRFVGKVGTGFDAETLADVQHRLEVRARTDSPFADLRDERGARWAEPELVCTVTYAEVTRACRLRAPSFHGLRPDLDPRACVLEDLLGAAGAAG